MQEDKTQGMKELIEQAILARKKSYSPYSHFQVGACLEGKSGKTYTGCNVENAAYSVTNCGERTAFFKAVSEGEQEFTRIVIVGGKEDGDLELCPPCGVCRQVMMEFCDPETFEIILPVSTEQYEIYLLKDLLPLGFGKANLESAN